jgi:hypothetical protein
VVFAEAKSGQSCDWRQLSVMRCSAAVSEGSDDSRCGHKADRAVLEAGKQHGSRHN